ncbi:MAG: hypothetical protein Q7S27_04730 [Nanoarchaeota archaeon]|nr:hypothetical protein [Nanoarchaeota archaeon]
MEDEMDFRVGLAEKAIDNVMDIGLNGLVDELCTINFPDLDREKIIVGLEFSDDKFPDVFVSPLFGGDYYHIAGNLPRSLIEKPYCMKVTKGILGHELTHISRGDIKGDETWLRNVLYTVASEGFDNYKFLLPAINNEVKDREYVENYFSRIERATDEEAIRRGLGKETYFARKYVENILKNYNARMNSGYHSSEKILRLINPKKGFFTDQDLEEIASIDKGF